MPVLGLLKRERDNLKSTTFLFFYRMPIEMLCISSGVRTFKCVLSLTLKKGHWAVLSFATVYYAVQGGSNFCFGAWNPDVWSFKWRLMSSILLWYCLLYCTRWFHLLVFWHDLLMKLLSIAFQMKQGTHHAVLRGTLRGFPPKYVENTF